MIEQLLFSLVAVVNGGCIATPNATGHVTIPDSVTVIPQFSFNSCVPSVVTMHIPDSVVVIQSSALNGCRTLTTLRIPDSVNSLGSFLCAKCSSLTSVFIPNSVGPTAIGEHAFMNCLGFGMALTNVSANNPRGLVQCVPCFNQASLAIPDTVATIGFHAFEICTSLVSVVIPDSVTALGPFAFKTCTNLASVSIPNSVTSLGANVFRHCQSLASIVVPDSVTSLGNSTFFNCSNLATIVLPDSITSVGIRPFELCPCIESTYQVGVSLCDCRPGTCGPTAAPTAEPTTVPTTVPTAKPTAPASSSSSSSAVVVSSLAAVVAVLAVALCGTWMYVLRNVKKAHIQPQNDDEAPAEPRGVPNGAPPVLNPAYDVVAGQVPQRLDNQLYVQVGN